MTDSRHDLGLVASLERRTPGGHSEAGVRLERSVTDYRMAPDSGAGPWELYTRTPIATMFARKASALSRDLELGAGVAVARGAGATWLDPDARVQWSVGDGLRLSASWTRRHQFVQSLRSPESVIGNVFPADLFVGSGAGGVPVARSDLAVLGADLRPSAGLRLGVEVYARRLAGLALVAPRSGEPFGMSGFATGSGDVRGASLDASFATERYAIVASYGLQRLRLRADSMRYVPEYGAAHLFDAGIILFPTATTSVRVGMAGAAGRRGTSSSDAVEWESCNLRDKGCELGGSPHYDPAALGAAALPPYLRFDLGVRQHFHVRVAGRSAVVAVFGTMTNVFGHTNVLTYAGDGLTGGRSTVEMRPLSPLVVGLDWQY
jgi:hypothetical protein